MVIDPRSKQSSAQAGLCLPLEDQRRPGKAAVIFKLCELPHGGINKEIYYLIF